jgi:hypothetical protein
MMRAALLCLLLLIAGCAAPAPSGPVEQCPPLPTLVELPTATQLAAYAQQVVDLYGQCATLKTSKGTTP